MNSKAASGRTLISSQELEHEIQDALSDLAVACNRVAELIETRQMPNVVLPSVMQASRGLKRSAEWLRAALTLLED